MNKTIKKLAMQAGSAEQTGPENWSDNQVAYFAELLLQECLEVLRRHESASASILEIRERFGIETPDHSSPDLSDKATAPGQKALPHLTLLDYPWGKVKKSFWVDLAEAKVYVRGVEYNKSGHVLLFQEEAQHLRVHVKGSDHAYEVTLGWDPQKIPCTLNAEDLITTCSCPHAAQGHVCKHVVAAGLELPGWWQRFQEKQQLLQAIHEVDLTKEPTPSVSPTRKRI